jgi:alanyl-tRNA synthetase
MTERLYYHDSFLHDFDARVIDVAREDGRTALVLDRTAFYATSGGQPYDIGVISANGAELRVADVVEREQDGAILHWVEGQAAFAPGVTVHGHIDEERRRDHMQQHSGQHVLSAAFIRLFNMPTVSFHMGAVTCTIDLATDSLSTQQVERAEDLANRVVTEDRPVAITFTSPQRARDLGVRKLPEREGEVRLIDIHDFDLTACGGTHVRSTGQIGAILLRKTEKVRQGVRVEFVCGHRAVKAARRDFTVLTEAAEVFSTHIYDVPAQIRKALDDAKAAGKQQQKLLSEIAGYEAAQLFAAAEQRSGVRVVTKTYADRDISYGKLVAQKVAAAGDAISVIASSAGQPSVVVAITPAVAEGTGWNAGALLKDALNAVGGRGGGSRDLAQGGVPDPAKLAAVVSAIVSRVGR